MKKEQKMSKMTFRSLFSWATKSMQLGEGTSSSGNGSKENGVMEQGSTQPLSSQNGSVVEGMAVESSFHGHNEEELVVKNIQVVYRNAPRQVSGETMKQHKKELMYDKQEYAQLKSSTSQPCLYDEKVEKKLESQMIPHSTQDVHMPCLSSPSIPKDLLPESSSTLKKGNSYGSQVKIIDSEDASEKQFIIKIHPKDLDARKSLKRNKSVRGSQSATSTPNLSHSSSRIRNKSVQRTCQGTNSGGSNQKPGAHESEVKLRHSSFAYKCNKGKLSKRQTWAGGFNEYLDNETFSRLMQRSSKTSTSALTWTASKTEQTAKAYKEEADASSDTASIQESVCRQVNATSEARGRGYSGDQMDGEFKSDILRRAVSAGCHSDGQSWTDAAHMEAPDQRSQSLVWSPPQETCTCSTGCGPDGNKEDIRQTKPDLDTSQYCPVTGHGPILKHNPCQTTPVETYDIWDEKQRDPQSLDNSSMLQVDIVDINSQAIAMSTSDEAAVRTRMAFKQCQCVSGQADQSILMAVMMSNVRSRGVQADIADKKGIAVCIHLAAIIMPWYILF